MKATDIPGVVDGMFFEYYVYHPMASFREEYLPILLQHFDIVFDHDDFPHKRHFEGREFKPQADITVSEFADILMVMKLRVEDEELLKRMPEELQAHFNEERYFDPFDDFSIADCNLLLSHLLRFRLDMTKFNTLPGPLKRHFMVYTRQGHCWRFGNRRPVA